MTLKISARKAKNQFGAICTLAKQEPVLVEFVVPIASEAMLPKHLPERLCPQVTIKNKPYRVIGFEAAAIPAKRLGPLIKQGH